jgi:PQQ-dependent dehydrogenase (methanol/ethanol family)
MLAAVSSCSRSQGALNANVTIPSQPGSEDGNWPTVAKDYANTRFSGLDQINKDNVKNLQVAWTFSTGLSRGHEAAPLVIGDTMYIVTPFPNTVYALDLKENGRLKWSYAAPEMRAAQGVACCDVVSRGIAYQGGRIFMNTLDGYTIAISAADGRQIWRTKVADIQQGESITMAPLIVKGLVLVGDSGGEFGVRGSLTALETLTGSVAWRAYSTGPDKEVLIGPEFKPPFEADRQKDLGVSTWPKDAWKIGGGTVWGFLSYDPQLDLVYYGTANAGPWNPDMRPGDNKWTSSVFARRPETGQAVWAYQFNPHDLYDHDGVNEMVLVDLAIDGKQRKLLLHPDRNGYLYAMDRTNGSLVSVDPFAYQNIYKGFDLKTGRPIHAPEKETGLNKAIKNICPAAPGGKDWQPSAFSPRTGLLYIPHNNLCMDHTGTEVNYISGTPYVGAEVITYAGPGGNRGEFTAWDPVAKKAVWKLKEDLPAWSGALVTAGDVVFYGTMDRWFKAVDARTGQLLWQFQAGSGVIGQPVSFKGPDGKQYIAVYSGAGGWAGAILAGLDPRDPTSALGMTNMAADLPKKTETGGQLFVFKLP